MRDNCKGATSLEKGVVLLFSFLDKSPQGIRELSDHFQLPVSTTYRLVRILHRQQLLEQDNSTRKYSLGLRLLQLQEPILRKLDLYQIALPHLDHLAELHSETVQLTVRSGRDAVTLRVIESKEALRFAPVEGGSVPLHCGAQAKAILGFLPEREIQDYLRGPLRAFTPHTVTKKTALIADLRRIRKAGCAMSKEEIYLGAAGVAAPIFDRLGKVLGSCGLSGPLQRMTEQQQEIAAADVRAAARVISEQLGCS